KTEEIRKEIEQARNEVEDRIDVAEKRGLPVNLSHLKPGDEVWIPRFKAQGVVMEIKLEEGKARVQIGTMRANLHEEEIERLEAPGESLKIQVEIPSRPQVAAGKDISWKLDLHGEKVEAALSALDKYLDNAVLANFPFVYVLHGRGTGALRQAIHSFLRKHPSVLRFRMGEGSEGGQGVTIVYLK
ncbi:MAG: Smr/MutS family protein, partial [Coprothermobacterota bacterium]|nr:Smr/MutS family protein [Coprothermobacterota bacterium]